MKIVCTCRYKDIWKNKTHDDSVERIAQQNIDSNEIAATVRGVNSRQVK